MTAAPADIPTSSPATSFLVMPSQLGDLLLAATAEGLAGVWFEEHAGGAAERARLAARAASNASDGSGDAAAASVLADARAQLEEYFAGARRAFDIPLAPGGTDFQRRVWGELSRIPFGETVTYGELATRVGVPTAVRAVGAANGQNPVSVVVPCHRVVGASGKLTGYGGGIERKRWLLAHEGRGTGSAAHG